MAESTNDHPEPRFVDPETALGGADAVEKTSYVVGKGTDPQALSPRSGPAEVGRRRMGAAAWAVIGIIVVAVIIYAFGIFGR